MADLRERLTIAIGASAGGLSVIRTIIKSLPSDFMGSIVIATHRSESNRNMLKELLDFDAAIKVLEPVDGGKLDCASVYVPPAGDMFELIGDELVVEKDGNRVRRMERIDDLLQSVARFAGKNSVGVMLSGLLDDGVAGMAAIKAAGGRTIVQSPADAEYSELPQNVLDAVEIDYVLDADGIADLLVRMQMGEECE